MLDSVKEIAFGAGDILVQKLQAGVSIEYKGSIDLVTDADKAAEKYVVEELRKRFPSHGILGEEGSRIEGSSDFLWIIDPIDGTTNFAHGLPYFAVSLGLVKAGEMVLGVVYNPIARECFVAEKGSGAFLNDQKITVSKPNTLHTSLLATGFPYDVATTKQDNLAAYERATKASQGVRCMGSAALDLCQVAAGRVEAFWERSLQPWDIAAGALIVLEAGGQISSCTGESFDPLGHEVCASNGLIHDELLRLIKG